MPPKQDKKKVGKPLQSNVTVSSSAAPVAAAVEDLSSRTSAFISAQKELYLRSYPDSLRKISAALEQKDASSIVGAANALANLVSHILGDFESFNTDQIHFLVSLIPDIAKVSKKLDSAITSQSKEVHKSVMLDSTRFTAAFEALSAKLAALDSIASLEGASSSSSASDGASSQIDKAYKIARDHSAASPSEQRHIHLMSYPDTLKNISRLLDSQDPTNILTAGNAFVNSTAVLESYYKVSNDSEKKYIESLFSGKLPHDNLRTLTEKLIKAISGLDARNETLPSLIKNIYSQFQALSLEISGAMKSESAGVASASASISAIKSVEPSERDEFRHSFASAVQDISKLLDVQSADNFLCASTQFTFLALSLAEYSKATKPSEKEHLDAMYKSFMVLEQKLIKETRELDPVLYPFAKEVLANYEAAKDAISGSPLDADTASSSLEVARAAVDSLERMDVIKKTLTTIETSSFFLCHTSKAKALEASSAAAVEILKLPNKELVEAKVFVEVGMKKTHLTSMASEECLGVYNEAITNAELLKTPPKTNANLAVYTAFINRLTLQLKFGVVDKSTDELMHNCDKFFNKEDAKLEGIQFPIHLVLKANYFLLKGNFTESIPLFLKAYEEAIKHPGTVTEGVLDTLKYQILNSFYAYAKDLLSKKDYENFEKLTEIISVTQDEKFGNLDLLLKLNKDLSDRKIEEAIEKYCFLEAQFRTNSSFHDLGRIFFVTELCKSALILNIPEENIEPIILKYKQWINSIDCLHKSTTQIDQHEPVRLFAISILNQGKFADAKACIESAISSGDHSIKAVLLKALAIIENESVFVRSEANIPKYKEAIKVLEPFIKFSKLSKSGKIEVDLANDQFNLYTSDYLALISCYISLLEKTGEEDHVHVRNYYSYVSRTSHYVPAGEIATFVHSQVDYKEINNLKILCLSASQFENDEVFAKTIPDSSKLGIIKLADTIANSLHIFYNIQSSIVARKVMLALMQFKEYGRAEALYESIKEFPEADAVVFSDQEKVRIAMILYNSGKKDEAFKLIDGVDRKDFPDNIKSLYARLQLSSVIEKKLPAGSEEYKFSAMVFGEVKNLGSNEDSYIFALKACNDKKTLAAILPKIKSRSEVYYEALCDVEYQRQNYSEVIKAAEKFFGFDEYDATRAQNVVNAHLDSLFQAKKYHEMVAKAIEYNSKGLKSEARDIAFKYATCFIKCYKTASSITFETLSKLNVTKEEVATLCKNMIVVSIGSKNFDSAKKHVILYAEIFDGNDALEILELEGSVDVDKNDLLFLKAYILLGNKEIEQALVELNVLFNQGYEFDLKLAAIKPSQYKMLEGLSDGFAKKFPNDVKIKYAKYLSIEVKNYESAVAIFESVTSELPLECKEAYSVALFKINEIDRAIQVANTIENKSYYSCFLSIKAFKESKFEECTSYADSYLKALKPSVKPLQELADVHIKSLCETKQYAELGEKAKFYKEKGLEVNLSDNSAKIADFIVKGSGLALEMVAEFGVKKEDVVKCYKDFMVSLVQGQQFDIAKIFYRKFAEIFPDGNFDEMFEGTIGILGDDVVYIEALIYLENEQFNECFEECLKLYESGYQHDSIKKTLVEASIKSVHLETVLSLLEDDVNAESLVANYGTSIHELYVKALKSFIYTHQFEKALYCFDKIKASITPDDFKYVLDYEAENPASEMMMGFTYLLAHRYAETKDEALKALAEPILEALYQEEYRQDAIMVIGEWFLYDVKPYTCNCSE